jgi:hypothetical protein
VVGGVVPVAHRLLGVQPFLDLPRIAVADDLAGVALLALGDAPVDVAFDGEDAAAFDPGHDAHVVDPADAVGAAPVVEDEGAGLGLGAPGVLLLEPLGMLDGPGELAHPLLVAELVRGPGQEHVAPGCVGVVAVELHVLAVPAAELGVRAGLLRVAELALEQLDELLHLRGHGSVRATLRTSPVSSEQPGVPG